MALTLLRCSLPPIRAISSLGSTVSNRRQPLAFPACRARNSEEEGDTDLPLGGDTVETLAVIGGMVANPVIGASLYALNKTGCGLPPGPGGALGALEGVSYLVLAGIVGWSIYTKARTGTGLPSGPFGLLGAVEGLSYLTVVGIVVVFGLQYFGKGYIPGPLPGDQCFG